MHGVPNECICMQYIRIFAAIQCREADINRHLELGKQLLAKGQFADALTHYHAAIGLLDLNLCLSFQIK